MRKHQLSARIVGTGDCVTFTDRVTDTVFRSLQSRLYAGPMFAAGALALVVGALFSKDRESGKGW
jgi:hypothetical protein